MTELWALAESEGYGACDDEGVSDTSDWKCRAALGLAMTTDSDNDTSVTRGPAIMKAGRLDAYESSFAS